MIRAETNIFVDRHKGDLQKRVYLALRCHAELTTERQLPLPQAQNVCREGYLGCNIHPFMINISLAVYYV